MYSVLNYYIWYPFVMLIRMARLTHAQIKVYDVQGTFPIYHQIEDRLYNGFLNLLKQTIGWILYLVSYITMFTLRQASYGAATTVLPLGALFFLDFDRGPNRKARRSQMSNPFVPVTCLDYRYAVYTAYCLYPWWNCLFGGASRWYTAYSNVLDLGYTFIEKPNRFCIKNAIIWPPDGIITSAALFLMLTFAQIAVITRLFLYCCQQRACNICQSISSIHNIFRGSYWWQRNAKKLAKCMTVLSVYAFTSEEAQLHEGMMSWDLDSTPAVIDNSANTHIWSIRDDFISGSLKYFGDSDDVGVLTIGDTASRPLGIGKVRTYIRDNDGQLQETMLEETLYFLPESPVNVISVTHLAQQFDDDNGTWIKTFRNRSEFTWNHGSNVIIDFHHPTSNLPVLNVMTKKHQFEAFCSLFETAQVAPQPTALMSCQTCLPTDSHGSCFVGDNIQEPSQKYRFTEKDVVQSPLSVGDKMRLTKNGVNQKVEIELIRLDEETQVPYFTAELDDGHKVEVTKEFLFPLDMPDLVHIPITQDQVRKHIDSLDIESLEALLNPPEHSELLKEFMSWHSRLGHMAIARMFLMSKHSYLPKRFLKLEKLKPKCPTCLIGKAKRKAWRTRAKPGTLRSEEDTKPGDATSMDHVISAQPGLVPRMDSKHTRERITAGCVFYDHVSRLSYTHMQTSANNDQTIEAKVAYERFAHNHGVKLRRFHADNGIFAEQAFKQTIQESPGQSITYCGVGAHHQNGLVERHNGTFSIFGSFFLKHSLKGSGYVKE